MEDDPPQDRDWESNGISATEAQQIRDNLGSNIILTRDEVPDLSRTATGNYEIKSGTYAKSDRLDKRVGITLHYTAGYSISSAVSTWNRHNSGICAHFIIGQDGDIEQWCAIQDGTGHAAMSSAVASYYGTDYNAANRKAISIELVQIGYMRNGSYDADSDTYIDSADNKMKSKFADGSQRVGRPVDYNGIEIPHYRTFTHYENGSKQQMLSLKALLMELSQIFQIEVKGPGIVTGKHQQI